MESKRAFQFQNGSFMYLKQFYIIVLLSISTNFIGATTINSLTSGNWNDGATWVGGMVPDVGDDVVIKNTHTVNVTANHSIIAITVDSGATLIIDATFSLTATGNIVQEGTFSVNGTLNLNGGSHTINVSDSFSGSGVININNTNSMTGTAWAPSVTEVNFYGILNGDINFTIANSTIFNWYQGNFELTNPITNDGTINIVNSGAGTSHNTESNINNNGTFNWNKGFLDDNAGSQLFTNNGSFNIGGSAGICKMNFDNKGMLNSMTNCEFSANTSLNNFENKTLNIVSGTFTKNSAPGYGFYNEGIVKGNGTLEYDYLQNGYSGIFSPGASPGTLNVTGDYDNSILNIEITNAGGPVTHDLLNISGYANFNAGTINITETGDLGAGSYVIVKAGSLSTSCCTISINLPPCYSVVFDELNGEILLKKGVVKIWDGSTSNWNTDGNWEPFGVPCPLDDVIINDGECNLDINPSLKSLTINSGVLKKVNTATYTIDAPIVVAAPGKINVFEGTLDINNTINNNGTIQGFGVIDLINATVIGGYGKWGPGNSTGTLGTTGTYDNEVIEMEIGGNGGGAGMVEIDFLSVSQTMNIGGDLIIPFLGGIVPPGIRTLMQCDGGANCRSGTFAPGNITFPPECNGGCSIEYTGNQVNLRNDVPIEFIGTCTWNGGFGNWSNAAMWSCNNVPDANDVVIIGSGEVVLGKNESAKTLEMNTSNAIIYAGGNNLNVIETFQLAGGYILDCPAFNVGNATLSGNITLANTNMTLSQGGNFDNPTLNLNNNASIILPASKTLTLNNQGTINNDFGLNFVNNGNMIKNGSGVFTFKTPYVNNGITNINAGTIKYDNDFTSTGLLKGNGTIMLDENTNVQIGPVNPGSSPGTFHVTGNYTNKHFLAEMLHSASVTTHDRIDVTANIQLQDSITIIKLAGEDIPYGTYTLMHCDGSASCITGNFNIVKYPAFCNGADCSLMISGQDVKFVFQAGLPVELSAFDARKVNTTVRLDWTISSEVDVREFIIERSSNTASWADLGSMAARGNSTESIKYFYIDNAPVDGNNFYRLRIIDQDGSFKYSPIVSVPFESAGNMQLFPNPVNQILTIRPPSNAEGNLWIVNSSGQTVIRQSLLPGEEAQIIVANLPAGLYAVCIPGIPCKSFVKE